MTLYCVCGYDLARGHVWLEAAFVEAESHRGMLHGWCDDEIPCVKGSSEPSIASEEYAEGHAFRLVCVTLLYLSECSV